MLSIFKTIKEMLFDNCKNTKKQGDVGVAHCISYYSEQGFTVCIPLTDSQNFDLIVDDGEKMRKIQVMTTKTKKKGVYSINLKSGVKKDCDTLFILLETGVEYEIPMSELPETSNFQLTDDFAKYIVIR